MITEGIKKLNKQFIQQLQNRSDIFVGVEYEFHYYYMYVLEPVVFTKEPQKEDSIYELFKLLKSYDLVDSDDAYDIWNGDANDISTSDELFELIMDEGHVTIDDEDSEKFVDTFNFYVQCMLNGFVDTDNKSGIIDKIIKENDFDIYDCDMLTGGEQQTKYTYLLMNLFESGYNINEHYELYTENLMNSNIAYDLLDTQEDGVYDDDLLEQLDDILRHFMSKDVRLDRMVSEYEHDGSLLEQFSEDLLSYILYSEVIDGYLYYGYKIDEFDASDREMYNVFTMDEDSTTMTLRDALEDGGIDYYDVETDNDNQVEVISETMTLSDGLINIDEMLDYIDDNGWTNDKSGMHISISSDKWKNKPFNVLKFFTLLNVDHIVKDAFPPRLHVGDLFDKYISDKKKALIHDYLIHEPSLSTAISKLFKKMETDAKVQMSGKLQSIKFDDYDTMDGRIELRYFGGEDYELRGDEIKKKMYEAIYVMELSYGNLYDREYKKSFVKLLNTIVDRYTEYNTIEEYHKYLNE